MEFSGLSFARLHSFVQPSPNLPLFPPPRARLHLYTNWKETKVHSHIGKFIAPKKMPHLRTPWIILLRLTKTPLRYSKQNHDLTANCQQMLTIESHQCGICVPENLRRPQTTHSYQKRWDAFQGRNRKFSIYSEDKVDIGSTSYRTRSKCFDCLVPSFTGRHTKVTLLLSHKTEN